MQRNEPWRNADPIQSSDITDEALFKQRRLLLKGLAATPLVGTLGLHSHPSLAATTSPLNFRQHPNFQDPDLLDNLTDETYATTYNNFYELGTSKKDPFDNADLLVTDPWSLSIGGLVNQPITLDINDLRKHPMLEERIYRFRCVEGWSMVVPWIGIELSHLLKLAEPKSNAKYVKFVSIHDPQNLPLQRTKILDWPYVEGLRMDEAMNPLTLMTLGMYGETLPNQSGAPLRLTVPWKYGFKGSKAVVHIELTDEMPQSAWMKASPQEYGFYANVNPDVSHRRWSQAKERPLGKFFKKKTLMFNGYAEQVAHLYKGMDLTQWI